MKSNFIIFLTVAFLGSLCGADNNPWDTCQQRFLSPEYIKCIPELYKKREPFVVGMRLYKDDSAARRDLREYLWSDGCISVYGIKEEHCRPLWQKQPRVSPSYTVNPQVTCRCQLSGHYFGISSMDRVCDVDQDPCLEKE